MAKNIMARIRHTVIHANNDIYSLGITTSMPNSMLNNI